MRIIALGFIFVFVGCGNDIGEHQQEETKKKQASEKQQGSKRPIERKVISKVENDIQKNEVSAQNILKRILTGQEMLRASKYIDQNNNGMGEYGFLEELAGHVKCRCANNEQTGPIFTDHPYIPKELGLTDTIQGESEYNVVELSGYCFRVFLPSADGSNGASKCTDPVHVPSAEQVYIAYGWPKEAGVTGNRVFVIDPTGCPYEWANLVKTYSGKENGPNWDAALNLGDSWLERSIDELGPGQTGVEGSQWVPSS